MPAFASFTKDQLYDIAEFLHMQVELVANRGIYKRLNVVTGDAQAGEAYFNGAGGCNACHSVTGAWTAAKRTSQQTFPLRLARSSTSNRRAIRSGIPYNLGNAKHS